MSLSGSVALVTGAGRGIGAAIARAALHRGARVIGFDRDFEAVQAVAAQLDPSGERTLPIRVDLSNDDALAEAMQEAMAWQSRIDILVNNAGITRHSPLVDLELAEWDEVWGVNIRSALLACKLAGEAMRAEGGGAIVNIASVVSEGGSSGITAYAVSKAALQALTRQVAVEWGPYGIRCNTVSPGINEWTTEGSKTDPAKKPLQTDLIPLRRLGTREDVAAAVMFLCSDQSAYITGQTLTIDGGYTLNITDIRRRYTALVDG